MNAIERDVEAMKRDDARAFHFFQQVKNAPPPPEHLLARRDEMMREREWWERESVAESQAGTIRQAEDIFGRKFESYEDARDALQRLSDECEARTS